MPGLASARITLTQLSYFIAVAEELHFGRAAKRLHIAQPPLSHAIRTLEANLGVALFERTSRQVVLTDAGAQLLPAARQALAAADRAVNLARAAAATQAGIVRVGFLGYGACDAIDLAIGAFGDESAPLRLQTRQAHFSDPAPDSRAPASTPPSCASRSAPPTWRPSR
jgi:DNA-binding transcriptional LysR family regulator